MPTDPREVVVTGCGDCPWVRRVAFGSGERACYSNPERPRKRGPVDGAAPPPDWCPLRERPVLVRLEVRDA